MNASGRYCRYKFYVKFNCSVKFQCSITQICLFQCWRRPLSGGIGCRQGYYQAMECYFGLGNRSHIDYFLLSCIRDRQQLASDYELYFMQTLLLIQYDCIQYQRLATENMLKILEQYIISECPSEQLDKLADTNEKLQHKISHLQHKISSFDEQNLPNSYQHPHTPSKEISHGSQLQSLKQILETDEKEIQQQLAIIVSQQQQVELFLNYIDIYLQETVNQPRVLQAKIKALQQLTKQSEHNPRQYEVLQRWTSSLMDRLNRRLFSLVTMLSNNCIKIQIEEIRRLRDLLNEETCRQFIKCIYNNCIVYDVPTQSYVLKKPCKVVECENLVLVHLECEVFKRQQAQKYYEHLFDSISSLNSISQKILGVLQDAQLGESALSLESVIKSEIKDSQADLKSIIEYILPYLHLEHRKQLLNILSSQHQNPTIYDLLVKLMIAGQDGEFMSQNVSAIVAKVKQDITALDDLYIFLSINMEAVNHRAYNIAFYVCDELVSELQSYVDYAWISRLLEMRENFRFKIHHPPN